MQQWFLSLAGCGTRSATALLDEETTPPNSGAWSPEAAVCSVAISGSRFA
jgi:hypothetical protein